MVTYAAQGVKNEHVLIRVCKDEICKMMELSDEDFYEEEHHISQLALQVMTSFDFYDIDERMFPIELNDDTKTEMRNLVI